MACETLIKSNLWGDNVDAVGVNILSGERSHRSHATHSHSLAMPWWEDSKAQWHIPLLLLLLHGAGLAP